MSMIRSVLRPASVALLFALAAGAGAAADDPRDFSGVWQAIASDRPERLFSLEDALSEAGRAMVEAARAPYPVEVEQGGWCVGPGMPRIMASMVSYPMEITQTPERITLFHELESQYRRIWMDGRGHPQDYLPTRTGHSIAHWEGNTLVIETKLLSEELFDRWPRTENTTVVERVYKIKRNEMSAAPSAFINNATIDDSILVFEITTTDPVLYKEPQKITVYYQHISDYDMIEYACSVDIWRNQLEQANQ